MKKSLIAMAVAATAGAAFAQSSVTLYGQMDVGYTADKKIKNNSGGTVAAQKGVTDGGYSGSRVGFRGEENLGGGIKAEFNAGLVLRRRLSIYGSTLRPRSVAFKTAIAAKLRERVWPQIEAGAIAPVIFKTFEAADAAQAHALMESNQHIGKIVLTW